MGGKTRYYECFDRGYRPRVEITDELIFPARVDHNLERKTERDAIVRQRLRRNSPMDGYSS
jgi:hypothetical protein